MTIGPESGMVVLALAVWYGSSSGFTLTVRVPTVTAIINGIQGHFRWGTRRFP